MKKWFLFLLAVAGGCAPSSSQRAVGAPADSKPATVSVAIAGDSTVSDYRSTMAQRGWGQLLPEFVDTSRVKVENFAAPGRSTKTFKSEGRWDKVLASKAKYVFIQFGHNDSHPKDRPEATDVKTEFPANLREFVISARAKGMIPILVTPMHRGMWKADKVHLTDELLPYVEAMRQVAAEDKVPVVDLYALTEQAFQAMTDEQLQTLFYSPATDRTHFGEKGARLLAGLVIQEADRLVPGFQADMGKPSGPAVPREETVAVATSEQAGKQTAPAPAAAVGGGASLVPNGDFSSALADTWTWSGNAKGQPHVVDAKIEGADSPVRALQFELEPAADATPWTFRLGSAKFVRSIARGDVVAVQFWARSTNPCTVEALIQRTAAPSDKVLRQAAPLQPQWQKFTYYAASKADFATGEAKLTILMGRASGTVELAGFRVEDLGAVAMSDAENRFGRPTATTPGRPAAATVKTPAAVEEIPADPEAPAAAKPKAAPMPPTEADVRYGPFERNVLDFYQAKSDKPTPVLFYMHGGGWTMGDKHNLPSPAHYLAAGISVVSINYRYIAQAGDVTPPVRAPLYDAARALQFVRSKAKEWNIDKQRIAASGSSAGACTALWLAFHDDLAEPKSTDAVARESTRLWCVAVSNAQTSLDPKQMKEWTPNSGYGGHAFGFNANPAKKTSRFAEFLAGREKILPWIAEYSPYALVTADDPPVYLTYSRAPALGQDQPDPTHTSNFGVKLQEHCKEIGVACELVYPGAPDVKHAKLDGYVIEALKAASAKAVAGE